MAGIAVDNGPLSKAFRTGAGGARPRLGVLASFLVAHLGRSVDASGPNNSCGLWMELDLSKLLRIAKWLKDSRQLHRRESTSQAGPSSKRSRSP
jgi:hypothetical protein